jgi:hypothetical protein
VVADMNTSHPLIEHLPFGHHAAGHRLADVRCSSWLHLLSCSLQCAYHLAAP